MQCIGINDQSGRNNPDDLPFYNTLRLFWIFHLLTDGDLIALFDKFCYIGCCGMVGNSA